MAEGTPERYVDIKTGRSTEHAEKVASSYNRMNLLAEVGSNLPDRTKLNFKDKDQPYVATSNDHGILEILKKAPELTGSKLDDKNFLRLSYGHMFKKIDEHWKNNPKGIALNPKTGKPKVYTVNFIQPGDKLYVKEGNLVVHRTNRDYYADFTVDLYPWPKAGTKPSAPAKPEATRPAPTKPEPPKPVIVGSGEF
mgnify:CR=1 FL=1